MKIKEHAKNWPPHILIGVGASVMIATCDKVLRARRYQGADDLTLDMRKRDRIEYTIVLDLPDGLHERALIAIVDAKEITLGELGELDI